MLLTRIVPNESKFASLVGQRETYAYTSIAKNTIIGAFSGVLCLNDELCSHGLRSNALFCAVPVCFTHAVAEEILCNRHGFFDDGDVERFLAPDFLSSEQPPDVFAPDPSTCIEKLFRGGNGCDCVEAAKSPLVELILRIGHFLVERYAVDVSDEVSLSTFWPLQPRLVYQRYQRLSQSSPELRD